MGKNTKKNKTDSLMKDALSSVKGGWASLYLVLILVVFVFYAPSKYGMIGNNKLEFYRNVTVVFLAVSVLLAIFSVLQLAKKKTEKKLAFNSVDIAMLLFGAVNLVSFLFSTYRSDALLGYEGWRMGLLTQLSFVAAYFIISRFSVKENYIPELVALFFVVQSIIIILQRCGNDPFGFYKGMDWFEWNRRNLLGTIGNINWLAGYQVCALPVILWVFTKQEKILMKILWGIGTYLCAASLIIQSSRSCLVALAGMMVVFFFFSLKKIKVFERFLEVVFMLFLFMALMSTFRVDLIEPMGATSLIRFYSLLWWIPTVFFGVCTALVILYRRKKKTEEMPGGLRIALLAVFGLCILAAIAVFVMVQSSDALIAKLPFLQSLRVSDESGSYRFLLWKESLTHFFAGGSVKNIFLGVGPDCYGYWYVAENIVLPISGQFMDAVYSNAHNDYITTLIQLGIPGLLIYLSVFVTSLVTLYKERKESPYAMLGFMLIAGYGIHNFFSFQQICSTPLFFLLMAFVLRQKKSE
jgi:hypothetical protein